MMNGISPKFAFKPVSSLLQGVWQFLHDKGVPVAGVGSNSFIAIGWKSHRLEITGDGCVIRVAVFKAHGTFEGLRWNFVVHRYFDLSDPDSLDEVYRCVMRYAP